MMRMLPVAVAMLILAASPGLATTPIPKRVIDGDAALAGLSLESAFRAVRTTTDPAKAESLADAAVALACEYLSHEDPGVRGIVLPTLSKFVETADLSGIALCIAHSPMDDNALRFLAQTLDRSRLYFLEESEKRRILLDCMRDGTTELWMGTVLTDSACMAYAAWDGTPGLEADIQDADPAMASQTTHERLIAVHSFLHGPGSGWDQREDAARQTLALGETSLGHRLREDASYRTIVLALLELHCTRGKKMTCDELRTGITSAIRSVITSQEETHWWQCAAYEKGRFTTAESTYFLVSTQPVEVTDEMIEEAMNRPWCDSWSPERYPASDDDPQLD